MRIIFPGSGSRKGVDFGLGSNPDIGKINNRNSVPAFPGISTWGQKKN